MKHTHTKNTILSQILLVCVIGVLLSGLVFGATFTVEETEEITLEVDATDPDGDDITFGFDTPFNENGVWKTNYDDAGEYNIDVSATDGVHTDVQTVTVVVLNKNRAPIVGKTHLSFVETDTIDLSRHIADPDDDILEYMFDAPFNSFGVWETGYNDAGRYVIDFVVNDGKASITDRMEIIIEETNQPPVISDMFSDSSRFLAFEDEEVRFAIKGEDEDGDAVSYLWFLDGNRIGDTSEVEYYFDFESEGEHILKVEITDGEFVVEEEWAIDVEKTNREPQQQDLEVSIYETETVRLDLAGTDLDGDQLTYSFEFPLNSDGTWETGYNDAGVHVLEGTVHDGEDETGFEVRITVLELDRAPIFSVPSLIELSEGQRLEWFVEVEDPDRDEIILEMSNLPEASEFEHDDKTVEWDVSFDYITRTDSFFFNILNSLRLEHYLLSRRDVPIEMRACGKELCSTAETTLRVFNTNRAPEFVDLFDQEASETDEIALYPTAIDPDGDIIRFRYSNPVGKWSGKWTTGYEDEGHYPVTVTATDGFFPTHETVGLTVVNTNREPTLTLKQDKVVVNEGQEFTLSFAPSDPDSEDSITVMMDSPPSNSGLDSERFVWTPSFDTAKNTTMSFWNKLITKSYYLTKKWSSDKEDVWLEFSATDGKATVVHPLHVVVKNVNRVPVIEDVVPSYERFETVTDVPIQFAVDAYDLDSDTLSYEWSFSGVDIANVKGTNVITRTFKSAGEKSVKVVVSDGRDSAKYEWTILVKATEKEPETHIEYLKQPDFSFRIYKIEDWK